MLPDDLPQPDRTDDEMLPDADSEDWSLIVSDDDYTADVPSDVGSAPPDRTDEKMLPEPETVEAVPVFCGAASTPQFESDVLAPSMASANETRRRESDAGKLSRQWMGWASKGLLMGTLFLGSFFAGLPFFGAKSAVPPVARQESREVKANEPAKAVDVPPLPPPLVAFPAQGGQPAAPVALAQPKLKASIYERVRQVVRENKTEETKRLGLGDVAYQDVPDDGSIMVGMAVTYAPFFTHNVIKSVRAIHQRPDGTRYDGPICGIPTAIGERVEAKEGYAIGGAAIKSGMGIDGMQLTFMEIGVDGLNPNKAYLSKWLGGNGGSGAQTFVNDGRPIVGIAGMWSKTSFGPAFCMCLVTTKAGALADAGGQERMPMQQPIMQRQQEIIQQLQRQIMGGQQ